jgi:hypothetical protein
MNFDLNAPVLPLLKYIVSFIVPMNKEIVQFRAKKVPSAQYFYKPLNYLHYFKYYTFLPMIIGLELY